MIAGGVFISHASEDARAAEAVCSALEAAGITCWIAPRDVAPGGDYASQILDAIGAARLLVVVVSAASNDSPHVRREVERAVSRDLPLLPLRVEDVTPTATLEYFLASTQWLDAIEGPSSDHLQAVVDAARRLLVAARPSPVPLPPLLVRPGDLAFAGRETELATIAEAASGAATGRGGLVLVGGEPGIGKTRVVAEAASRLHRAGAVVLAGGCLQQGVRPYQPFTEALAGFATTAADAAVADALGSDGVILASLVPEIGRRLGGDAARSHPVGDDSAPFFDAVTAVLGRLAALAPLVLVLDDLQWADRAGLDLLVHVLRSSAEPMLLLGTYRDTEVGADHPLVAVTDELNRAGVVRHIRLRGLDREAVGAMVRDVDLPGSLAGPVYDQTDGNALFVREVALGLASLAAAGTPELSRLPVPDGVRAVIRQRLRSLGDDASTVLMSASVIGRTFDASLLSAVVGADVLDDLESGVAARLVEEVGPGSFRFTHDLVREALLAELSLTRQAGLHRAVATALEAQVGEPSGADAALLSELADHWMAVGDDDGRTRGAAWEIRAGDATCRVLAFDAARAHYERALAALGPGRDLPLRSDSELGLALVARRAGDVPTAVEHFDRAAVLARTAGDVERLALLAVEQAGYFPGVISVDEATAREALREALADLPEEDSGLRARVLACLSWLSPVEEADHLSAEAVAMARRVGDLNALANALHAREWYVQTWFPATFDERLELDREAEQVDLAAGEWELYVSLRFAYVDDACLRGDVAGVRRHSQELRRFSDERRWAYGQAFADLTDGGMVLAAGDIGVAEELAQRALEVGAGVRNVEYQYAGLLFWLRFEQCRLQELAPLFDLIPEGFSDLSIAVHRAVLLTETGPADAARPFVEKVVAAVFDGMAVPGQRGSAPTMLAGTVASVAGPDVMRRVRDHLRGLAGTWQGNFGITWIGPVDLPLAILSRALGELDEASGHVERALELLKPSGLALLTGRARVERARIAARAGRIADAVVEASEVRSWAQDRGLPRTVHAADEVLADLRSPEARS